MSWILIVLAAGAIVVLDQVVKALVVANIPLGGAVPLLPGIVHLTYLQNTGAAFSMLEGARVFFVLLTFAFLGAFIYAVAKKLLTGAYLWIGTAIVGGAVGNLIDRILTGYVVDMFQVEFMNFAVFNVADIFITCGAAALFLYALLFDRSDREKKENSDDRTV